MANLGLQNNNPGNLKDPATGQFRVFNTPEEGENALIQDLKIKQSGQSKVIKPGASLQEFSDVWAPSSDNNNPQNYAKTLATTLGVDVNHPFDQVPTDKLAGAIKVAEGTSTMPMIDTPTDTTPQGTQNPPAQSPLVQKVRAKYPQYADMSDADLEKAVLAKYPQYADLATGASAGASVYNPKPFSDPNNTGAGDFDFSDSTATPTQTTSQPEGIGSKALDVAKGVGNFLFPIVSDVYHDVKGDQPRKTFLQQAGDFGLSALPFIPGLGEAGEAARGAEAGVAGVDALKGSKGLLEALKGSPVAKGALTGYGAGTAQNLSQGKGLGESLLPDSNNLVGALLGGITPKVFEGVSALAKKTSGVTPQIENALKERGISVEDYDKYINAAKTRTGDISAPSPLNLAADKLDEASSAIDKKASEAGAAVGAAKNSLEGKPFGDVVPVAKDFADRVRNDYGLELSQDEKGVVSSKPVAGRTTPISPSEVSRIEATAQDLADLHGSNSARQAADVIKKLDNSIDYAKASNGKGFDPIEGLLSKTRQGIDAGLRKVAPDLASANDRASELYKLKNEIDKMAGGNNQKGELLMRRIFSGDKSGEVQDLFGKIKNETGVDLVNHAVLAKHAIETLGDASQRTLLEQAIEGGVGMHSGGFVKSALNLGSALAKKTFANPEKIGRNLVEKKAGRALPYAVKSAIELGARIKK